MRGVLGRDLRRELAVVHQRAVEPVLLVEVAEDRRQDVERLLVRVSARHGRPDQLGPGERDLVGHRDVPSRVQFGDPGAGCSTSGPFGSGPKYFAIHCFACAGSKSPARQRLALFGA